MNAELLFRRPAEVPLDHRKLQAQSFAVEVFQRIGPRLSEVEVHFAGFEDGMPGDAFVALLRAFLSEQEGDFIVSRTATETSLESRRDMHDTLFHSVQKARAKPWQVEKVRAKVLAEKKRKELLQTAMTTPMAAVIGKSRASRELDRSLFKTYEHIYGNQDAKLGFIDFFRDEFTLNFSLWELFRMVTADQEGLKTICWESFLVYLINANVAPERHTLEEAIGDYEALDFQEQPQWSAGCSRLLWFSGLNQFAALCGTRRVKLLDPGKKHSVPLAWRLMSQFEVPEAWESLKTVEHLAGTDIVALSCGDRVTRFWEPRPSSHIVGEYRHEYSQSVQKWDARHGLLYSCASVGYVEVLRHDIHKTGMERVTTLRDHTGTITDLLILPSEELVCTTGMDKTIFVYDGVVDRTLRRFDGHRGGVLSLSFSRHYNFLTSVGQDREPHLWPINMPATRPFLLRDPEARHTADVISVFAVPFSAQLLTFDRQGTLLVWDIRTLRAVQALQCEPDWPRDQVARARWGPLCYVEEERVLLTLGPASNVYAFQYACERSGKDNTSATKYPIVSAAYQEASHTMLTASGREVVVWELQTGAVWKSYSRVAPHDVTAICCDFRGKHFFIACRDGALRMHDLATGALQKHVVFAREALRLQYCTADCLGMPEREFILLVAGDGQVYVFDPFCQVPVVRFQSQKFPIDARAAVFSPIHGNVLMGQAGNSVLVWDWRVHKSKDGRLSATDPAVHLFNHFHWVTNSTCNHLDQAAEVTAICVLGHLPAFVCADSRGALNLWSFRQAGNPQLLSTWYNYRVEGIAYIPSVTCIAHLDEQHLLYTADDFGRVAIWDVGLILARWLHNVTPLSAFPAQLVRLMLLFWRDHAIRKLRRDFASYLRQVFAPNRKLMPMLLTSVQCHRNFVSALLRVKMPLCFVTTGEDAHMYVWSPKLTCLAYFSRYSTQHYSLRFPFWTRLQQEFPRSMFRRHVQRALSVIDEKHLPEEYHAARRVYADLPRPWGHADDLPTHWTVQTAAGTATKLRSTLTSVAQAGPTPVRQAKEHRLMEMVAKQFVLAGEVRSRSRESSLPQLTVGPATTEEGPGVAPRSPQATGSPLKTELFTPEGKALTFSFGETCLLDLPPDPPAYRLLRPRVPIAPDGGRPHTPPHILDLPPRPRSLRPESAPVSRRGRTPSPLDPRLQELIGGKAEAPGLRPDVPTRVHDSPPEEPPTAPARPGRPQSAGARLVKGGGGLLPFGSPNPYNEYDQTIKVRDMLRYYKPADRFTRLKAAKAQQLLRALQNETGQVLDESQLKGAWKWWVERYAALILRWGPVRFRQQPTGEYTAPLESLFLPGLQVPESEELLPQVSPLAMLRMVRRYVQRTDSVNSFIGPSDVQVEDRPQWQEPPPPTVPPPVEDLQTTRKVGRLPPPHATRPAATRPVTPPQHPDSSKAAPLPEAVDQPAIRYRLQSEEPAYPVDLLRPGPFDDLDDALETLCSLGSPTEVSAVNSAVRLPGPSVPLPPLEPLPAEAAAAPPPESPRTAEQRLVDCHRMMLLLSMTVQRGCEERAPVGGFTSSVLEAIATGSCVCIETAAASVRPIHVAAALLLDAAGPAARMVNETGASPEALYNELLRGLPLTKPAAQPCGEWYQPPLSEALQTALEAAAALRDAAALPAVTVPLFLLALCQDGEVLQCCNAAAFQPRQSAAVLQRQGQLPADRPHATPFPPPLALSEALTRPPSPPPTAPDPMPPADARPTLPPRPSSASPWLVHRTLTVGPRAMPPESPAESLRRLGVPALGERRPAGRPRPASAPVGARRVIRLPRR